MVSLLENSTVFRILHLHRLNVLEFVLHLQYIVLRFFVVVVVDECVVYIIKFIVLTITERVYISVWMKKKEKKKMGHAIGRYL